MRWRCGERGRKWRGREMISLLSLLLDIGHDLEGFE
jgi:hypothetical protein